MNGNQMSQEDMVKFESIFCLLVDGTEAPVNRAQSPAAAHPSDRSVTPCSMRSSVPPWALMLSPFTAQITGTNCCGLCKSCFIWVCRAGSLIELAVLALQVKHQKVAEECLKELKSAGEAVSVQCVLKTCCRRSTEEKKMDSWLWHALLKRHFENDYRNYLD